MNHKDLCIALAFPKLGVDEWIQLANTFVKPEFNNICFEIAETKEELLKLNPPVIISHESNFVTEYIRDNPSQLRWIHFMSAGLNKTLSALGKKCRPFSITNVGGIHNAAMKEYVFCSILHFEKKISTWNLLKKQKKWIREPLNILAGKKMLVLGTGNIGTAIAELAKAFSTEVTGISRSGKSKVPFDSVATLRDLEAELPRSDYVVLALPLTDETLGIFDKRKFDLMNVDSIFINISRGELIDEHALAEALVHQKISGAAMDAFSEEPLGEDSTFWNTPNLLITPHVAGKFPEGRKLGMKIFTGNLHQFINNRGLGNLVYPERGY